MLTLILWNLTCDLLSRMFGGETSTVESRREEILKLYRVRK